MRHRRRGGVRSQRAVEGRHGGGRVVEGGHGGGAGAGRCWKMTGLGFGGSGALKKKNSIDGR
jgi:hypothetical protein